MQYIGTVIAVRDMERARSFYEELFGLTVFQDYGINIMFHGGLSLQQAFDWLVGLSKEDVRYKSHNMELCFEEEHFDDFLQRLAQMPDMQMLGGVITHSWGQRVVRFYDPDGHLIEVGESMPMVIRRFLDSGMTIQQVSKRMDVSVEDLEKLLCR